MFNNQELFSSIKTGTFPDPIMIQDMLIGYFNWEWLKNN